MSSQPKSQSGQLLDLFPLWNKIAVMKRNKKLAAVSLAPALVLAAALAGSAKPPGFYRDSTGDLARETISFYAWYAYKYVHPVKTAAPELVRHFKTQDLKFTAFPQTIPISRIKIVAAGDIMVKTRMSRANSSHLFDDIARQLEHADIAFGNLEGPADPRKKVSAFPRYNFRSEMVEFFRQTGFDVFSTANNHSLDQGWDSLVQTLDFLDRLGVYHTGTARSKEERDNNFPVLDVNGIRIAFLAYTFATNGRKIPEDKPWCVNLVDFNVIGEEPDLSLVQKDIKAARARGAEVVVVAPHWSLEYEFYPPERLVAVGHRLIEMGADIILGSHPHCLEPMEKYIPQNPGRVGLPEAFIIYSLGNFIPDSYPADYRTSVLLGIELAKAESEEKPQVRIQKIELIPVFFHAGDQYRIIRIDQALAHPDDPGNAFLKPGDRKTLARAQELLNYLFLPESQPLQFFLP